MKVSIVIPVLDEEEYILPCLESVKSFNKPNNVQLTTHIVDGGSNDNTVSLVKNFIHNNKNYILLDQSCFF